MGSVYHIISLASPWQLHFSSVSAPPIWLQPVPASEQYANLKPSMCQKRKQDNADNTCFLITNRSAHEAWCNAKQLAARRCLSCLCVWSRTTGLLVIFQALAREGCNNRGNTKKGLGTGPGCTMDSPGARGERKGWANGHHGIPSDHLKLSSFRLYRPCLGWRRADWAIQKNQPAG